MTTQTETTATRKPSHRLYIVLGEGEKAIWRPVGAGWCHGDGKGFNLAVDALPLQGRLVLREIKAKGEDGADQGRLV